MKMVRGFAALLCLACIVACAPSGGVANSGPPATTGVASRTALDERLLYAAETAYNVPAHAYVTANANHQLSPAVKARAKAMLEQAYARLQDARRLYALGNAESFTAAANAAIGLANSARGLLPAAQVGATP